MGLNVTSVESGYMLPRYLNDRYRYKLLDGKTDTYVCTYLKTYSISCIFLKCHVPISGEGITMSPFKAKLNRSVIYSRFT